MQTMNGILDRIQKPLIKVDVGDDVVTRSVRCVVAVSG